jgi:hypothetical protein
MVIQKAPTKKKLAKRDRDTTLRIHYQNLPPGTRSYRLVARYNGVSAATVFFAVNGRKKKK